MKKKFSLSLFIIFLLCLIGFFTLPYLKKEETITPIDLTVTVMSITEDTVTILVFHNTI